MVKLECLPNELFLELFDYFDGIDLLHLFFGLNSRFNHLLYEQVQHYRFKFTSASKRRFDIICQQHLPFIACRTTTLLLSNHDDTPEQIDFFLSYVPSWKSFTDLQSLSLAHVSSYQTLFEVVRRCSTLVNLNSLTLNSCVLESNQSDFQVMLDMIWSLAKLRFCQLDIMLAEEPWIFASTKVSLCLEQILIYRKSFELNELNRLYECTPHLKHLSVLIASSFNTCSLKSSFSTLVKLNMRLYERSNDLIEEILQTTQNVRCLEMTLLNNLIDGHRWEQIIRTNLLNLTKFRLRMKDTLPKNDHLQERLNKLFYSFQSRFWIHEHRWFIRCLTWDSTIHLYTLPRKVNYYEQKLPDSRRSTSPHDDDEEFYNNITNIHDETFFNQPIPYSMRLSQIKHLRIKLPIDKQFWSIVPSLKKLISLTIESYMDVFQWQVQTLLDRACHLQNLSIKQDASLPLQSSLFDCTNTSVDELDLGDLNYTFHENDCIRLAHSPLCSICHILSIVVKERQNVVTLVRHMKNLQTLKVQLKDGSNDDNVIQWLRNNLSSTYVIVKSKDDANNILIWM
ncbi:unnamed protein product [Adineta ricciae]|uniref:F-box domain-containing protein n=1 Tax=Adineta ricciae TaxID=249248 RepID=A0A814TG89_ADIRI|nr:unnamed protein product [Adineta ricciae]CAF1316478.1 unnamed protein product [Adineta ricciae]